ncbi:MAG TPA: flagellar protein FlgN [Pseudomonas xinjiangensis]|uniref:Flagellar protein FlgN n=2 Tax=root TaxID=1 RepID=A0A7V1BSG4_9GAMM|nr:flagellar protein FlgN [Halopseudomonas xinjiangensis]HEC46217.1 flagellar protein FlgN [Halopseudomonas xinjiangensis]
MKDLEQLFDQATRDCEQFAELLDQEQDALIKQDMDVLESLLEAKTPLVTALNAHDETINSHAHLSGKLPDQTMESFVASLGHAGTSTSYSTFRQTLVRCQSANLRNARLVRHSQNANNHLVDLLRNQGESSQSVYDRQGITSRSNSQRPLTKV